MLYVGLLCITYQFYDSLFLAPKITSNFYKIHWDSMTSQEVFNLGRAVDGLNPLHTTWGESTVKLTNIKLYNSETLCSDKSAGYAEYDKQLKVLKILCSDLKFVTVENLGILGKRVMSAQDFKNGYMNTKSLNRMYFK